MQSKLEIDLKENLHYNTINVVIIIVNNKKNKSKESYICEGMCFGMSFGLLLGTSFSSEHLGLFLSMGIY